jgi:hypothetical protein
MNGLTLFITMKAVLSNVLSTGWTRKCVGVIINIFRAFVTKSNAGQGMEGRTELFNSLTEYFTDDEMFEYAVAADNNYLEKCEDYSALDTLDFCPGPDVMEKLEFVHTIQNICECVVRR